MLKAFDSVHGTVKNETELAVCLKDPVWYQDGADVEMHGGLWIPKANLHPDSLDTIEEAVEGEEVEIHVARWWLQQTING